MLSAAAPVIIQKPQPTWLIVLQSASYGVGILGLVVAALAFWFQGLRIRARAYMDKLGRVIVELDNRGRAGGSVAECYIVHTQQPKDDYGGYPLLAECRELPLGGDPLALDALGGKRLTFTRPVDQKDRVCAKVLMRYTARRTKLLKPERRDNTIFLGLPD